MPPIADVPAKLSIDGPQVMDLGFCLENDQDQAIGMESHHVDPSPIRGTPHLDLGVHEPAIPPQSTGHIGHHPGVDRFSLTAPLREMRRGDLENSGQAELVDDAAGHSHREVDVRSLDCRDHSHRKVGAPGEFALRPAESAPAVPNGLGQRPSKRALRPPQAGSTRHGSMMARGALLAVHRCGTDEVVLSDS